MSEIVHTQYATHGAPESPSSLQMMTAALHELAGAAQSEDAYSIRRQAYAVCHEYEFIKIMQEGTCTAAELADVFGGLYAIDEAVEGPPTAWHYLHDAGGTNALMELSSQEGTILDRILRAAMDAHDWRHKDNAATYKQLVSTAKHVTMGRFGNISDWRAGGHVVPTNAEVEELAAHSGLPDAFIELTREQVDSTTQLTNIQKMSIMRRAERTALHDMLGLPKDLSASIRLAIEGRTMRIDGQRIVPLENGGGIDPDAWENTMRAMAAAANTFGANTLRRLHETCGIVNFDRYTSEQLERMRLFSLPESASEEDKIARAELLARLRNSDTRTMLSDAYGDPFGSFNAIGETFETRNGTLLVFEVRRRGDIYRHPARVRRADIRQASTVLVFHGNERGMRAGPAGDEIRITGDDISPERHTTQHIHGATQVVNIGSTVVWRFFRDYMQPSQLTGEREVILLSCFQAKRRQGGHASPADRLVSQADPADNVVIYAGAAAINMQRNGVGLQFIEPSRRARPANAFRIIENDQDRGSRTGNGSTTRVRRTRVPMILNI